MNSQIAGERRRIAHAGSPADRRGCVAAAILHIAACNERFQGEAQASSQAFRRFLAAWLTEDVPSSAQPFAIQNDIHRARLYLVAALLTGLGECGLAAWIFAHWQVPWWIGAVTAVIVTVVLHGAFHVLAYEEQRPRRALYLIKRYAVAPASLTFFVAFAVFALARYTYDPSFVLILLPAFSIGLWLGTLSLLVLSAGLFTIAHILNWSRRTALEFWAIKRHIQENENFLRELRSADSSTPNGSYLNSEVSDAVCADKHTVATTQPELVGRFRTS